MRRRILCLNLNLFFLASVVSAQTPAVKVCVTQDNDDGYDALRPAQEIASRKLADGTRVGVVAVTPGAPSPDWERMLTDPQSPIQWVNVAGRRRRNATKKSNASDAITTLKSGIALPWRDTPPEPDAVVYEMKKAGSKKVLCRAALPPRTVHASRDRDHRQFVPYPIFANEIVKKRSKQSVQSPIMRMSAWRTKTYLSGKRVNRGLSYLAPIIPLFLRLNLAN